MPVPLRHEAGLAAGVVLDLLEGGPAHLLNAAAGDADQVVVMRAVVLDLEARGPAAADDRGDEPALLEHLERAEHRGAAHPVRAQGEVDLILAEVRVGLEEMIKDEAALPGQAQAVLRQVLGERAHDLFGVLLIVSAFVDDELSHADRVSVWAAGRNILVITPCYNREVKRFWSLSIILLLALPLRAQEGGDADIPEGAPAEASPQEGDVSPPGDAPVAEPNSSESQPSEDDGGDTKERPSKEEPLVSVKVVTPLAEEGDEEDVSPAAPTKKVESTTLLGRTAKKGKSAKAPKGAKGKKGEKGAPAVVKTKAPTVAPEPPPPPVPAVPLTPITPRNP